MSNNLYHDWLEAFRNIGTPAISKDTAARILAVVYVHGNNEALTENTKFVEDLHHIEEVYHVSGGEIPDEDVRRLVNKYVEELEAYYEQHKNDDDGTEAIFKNHAPRWAKELFMQRYGIKLIN